MEQTKKQIPLNWSSNDMDKTTKSSQRLLFLLAYC